MTQKENFPNFSLERKLYSFQLNWCFLFKHVNNEKKEKALEKKSILFLTLQFEYMLRKINKRISMNNVPYEEKMTDINNKV